MPMCNMNPLQCLYCRMLFSNVGNKVCTHYSVCTVTCYFLMLEIKTPMCNMNPLQCLYCGMLFSNVGNKDAHVQYEPTTVFVLWHVIF